MTDKPAHTPYAQIPQTMRDVLDTTYTLEGVEVWWNARQRWFSGMTARDLWRTVRGRERVREVVSAIEDGGAS